MAAINIAYSSEMLERVLDFPNQMADAFASSVELAPSSLKNEVSRIVFLGMGGSGIVGDFLHVLLGDLPIPMHICKNPIIPKIVDHKTLVIAVTYSGKTHETLAALRACASSGARIVLVTSSTELAQVCKRRNIYSVLIPGNGYTRASLGYLLTPILILLQKFGIINRVDMDIVESIKVLEKIRNDSSPILPIKHNPIRLLALHLTDRFPVIYGTNNFTDAVALRWKQLLNENSKIHCYYEVFPELFHNEIEAWNGDKMGKDNYELILLRDSAHERSLSIQEKIEMMKRLVEAKGAQVTELWSNGSSKLARLLSLSYKGDLASVYLAMAKGTSAAEIKNIEAIKKVGFTKGVLQSAS